MHAAMHAAMRAAMPAAMRARTAGRGRASLCAAATRPAQANRYLSARASARVQQHELVLEPRRNRRAAVAQLHVRVEEERARGLRRAPPLNP